MPKPIICLISLLLLSVSTMQAQNNNTKPNILFIMSDDHTSQAIGAYGGRLQELNPTPTIDKLAEEGIIMQNAFCTNAICTPSRACIMTGQYSAVNGATTLRNKLMPANQYLATEMKKAGYQTAVIGKWHLKERPESFDYYKVLYRQGEYINPHFLSREGTETFVRTVNGRTSTIEGTEQMMGHSSDCIAESTLDWFKNRRDDSKPFFMKMHFKAPHDMFTYAPRYESYLADVHIPEPENLFDHKNHGSIATRGANDELVNYIGTSVSPRNTRRNYSKAMVKGAVGTDEEIAKETYQIYLKKYLRCVKGVDDNVKKVLDYLKAENLLDNTIIIYTGDQGFYLGEHDYIDKRWGYEEGMRMPFIVRYPKAIPAGSTSDAIIENVDYPVMMLDYAGVEKPDYMQGYSFRSIMETGKEPKEWKKAAYYHYWMHMSSHDNPAHIGIRTKTHKLLYFYGAGENSEEAETPPAWELYDLVNDPHEMNNIYDNPENAKLISELKERLKALRKEYKEDDPKFKCNKVIDDFWDYSDEDRQKAIEISHQYRAYREKNNSYK